METFPDFFQEDTPDARRDQVGWLESHLNLSDAFFSKVLATDEASIANWRYHGGQLDLWQEERLQELWRMFLHILSATNFDDLLARSLLSVVAAPCSAPTFRCVPWGNQTLREFLERKSPDAIRQVTAWLSSLRFTDRLSTIAG